MLTFFRHIRKSLLGSGQVRKYILYATGEILLVMVGILLALQVNNWNEWRKDRIKEREILGRMKNDLKKDTAYLNQRIQLAENEWKSYYKYIHQSYQVQKTREDYLTLKKDLTFNAENLILQDKTFAEITNAGRVDLLTGDELKDSIINYYREYSIAAAHIAEMNQTSISMITTSEDYAPSMKYEDGILSELFDSEFMFFDNEWRYINDPQSKAFKSKENAIAYYAWKQRIFKSYYQKLLERAKKLLIRIERFVQKDPE